MGLLLHGGGLLRRRRRWARGLTYLVLVVGQLLLCNAGAQCASHDEKDAVAGSKVRPRDADVAGEADSSERSGSPLRNPCKLVENIDREMSAEEFVQRHVVRQAPVLLVDAATNTTAAQIWSLHYMLSVPHGLTTWVNVREPEVPGQAAEQARRQPPLLMLLREFVVAARNRSAPEAIGLVVEDEVPAFMQKDFILPRVLQCRDVLRQLTSHNLQMGFTKFETPFVRSAEDRMICAISGRVYFDLVRAGASGDSGTLLSTPNFDCRKTVVPEIGSALERRQAKIMSGDCLYIPRTWAYAAKANGQHMTVSIRWETPANASGEVTCGRPPATSLLGAAKKFAHATTQRNPEDDALLHYFLFYLGDGLTGSFKEKQFARKLKQDQKLLSKLTSWDDECADIAKELFESLDIDKDGVFCAEDLKSLRPENVDAVIAQIRDRLIDFNGVIAEQQKQAVKKAARKLTDLHDELQSRFAEELDRTQPAGEQSGSPGGERSRSRQSKQSRHERPPLADTQEQGGERQKEDVVADDLQDYVIVDDEEEVEVIADDDDVNSEGSVN